MVIRQQDRRPEEQEAPRALSARPQFTLDGVIVSPSPAINGVPDFRWTYDGVDPYGIYIRAIVTADTVDEAVSLTQNHFPSFRVTTSQPGSVSREDQTSWFGLIPSKKRRNWLTRLFIRTRDL